MGYLHEGHMSLVRRARAENDVVIVTIFVNPTQFGPNEDLAAYPRDLPRDLSLLDEAGVDLVFVPSDREMYPPGFQTYVSVQELTRSLEGAARPGHFRGVTTVVAKLFNLTRPDRAYFGQKDAQQVRVIRQMVADLNFDLEVVVCPIVRDEDGLALSSRNNYLSPEERAAAPVLYRALRAAEARYLAGEQRAEVLRTTMREVLAAEPLAEVEYVSVADLDTLAELDRVERGALASMAVRVGPARLIDNLILNPPATSE
jgi:pantoate--beta-alanine ligase